MNDLAESQERARLFNEAEHIQREIEDRRAIRRLLGPESPLPDCVLDELEWLGAVHTHRQIRSIVADVP